MDCKVSPATLPFGPQLSSCITGFSQNKKIFKKKAKFFRKFDNFYIIYFDYFIFKLPYNFTPLNFPNNFIIIEM